MSGGAKYIQMTNLLNSLSPPLFDARLANLSTPWADFATPVLQLQLHTRSSTYPTRGSAWVHCLRQRLGVLWQPPATSGAGRSVNRIDARCHGEGSFWAVEGLVVGWYGGWEGSGCFFLGWLSAAGISIGFGVRAVD